MITEQAVEGVRMEGGREKRMEFRGYLGWITSQQALTHDPVDPSKK